MARVISVLASPGSNDNPIRLNYEMNAPRAVILAAILYVLRALVGRAIPLNSGCLRDVTVCLPEPSILSPSAGRAVAGGHPRQGELLENLFVGSPFGRRHDVGESDSSPVAGDRAIYAGHCSGLRY